MSIIAVGIIVRDDSICYTLIPSWEGVNCYAWIVTGPEGEPLSLTRYCEQGKKSEALIEGQKLDVPAEVTVLQLRNDVWLL